MATKSHFAASGSDNPTLAVIICTRDRPDSLQETLNSIWAQSHKPDELIVIDDGDLPADTRTTISTAAASHGIAFQCEKSKARGLTKGRNQAARLAASEVLVYLDDDVTCRVDFLRRLVRLFHDVRVAGVTATVDEPLFESTSARLFQLGYRLAGWWRVAPRGKPPRPAPWILSRPHVAVRARWLSGAAMALRRDVVLANPFDEELVEYALGEDREMGYRIGSRHWLLESKFARVTHRRDPGQRLDGRRFGFMTVRNYLYIIRKTCRPGVGDALLIGWNLAVIMAMHAVWMVGPGRRFHLQSLKGMFAGLVDAGRRRMAEAFVGSTAIAQSPINPTTCATGLRTPALSIPNGGNAGGRPRRVLFVTNRLENGGAELMLIALVQKLVGLNIQPFVLCLKDAGPLAAQCRDSGVPVFDGFLRYKFDASVIPRIRRLIFSQRIDVVVAAHSGGDRMFWSTLAAKLTGTPMLVWSHWFPLPGQNHFERSNRALFRFVDAFIALGERHRAALIRHEQVPAGRITVIPNAIDLDRFPRGQSRPDARRALNLSDDQIAVAIIANLRREKRHDVFIAAAKTLSKENPSLRFFIIGDGPHRDAVHSLAASSGLAPEVLRLLGPRDDVPALLPGIDISCLCSEQECFSVTMLEAAVAGCPFIGPDTGCMPEFLTHRETGLLIPPADAEALTAALRELTADRKLRDRLARAARQKVTAHFSMEQMARSFADLIQSLPAKPTPRVRQSLRDLYPTARAVEIMPCA